MIYRYSNFLTHALNKEQYDYLPFNASQFSEGQNLCMCTNRHKMPEMEVGDETNNFMALFIPRQQNSGNVLYLDFFSVIRKFFLHISPIVHNGYGPVRL